MASLRVVGREVQGLAAGLVLHRLLHGRHGGGVEQRLGHRQRQRRTRRQRGGPVVDEGVELVDRQRPVHQADRRPPPRRSTCRRTARSPWPGPGRPAGAAARRRRCRGRGRAWRRSSRAGPGRCRPTRSQPSASDKPAPTATPSTLAMVGLVTSVQGEGDVAQPAHARRGPSRLGSVAGPLGSPRSAPEQKAPPAPVRTMTRSSGWSSTSSKVVAQLDQHLAVGGVLALGAVHRDGDDAVLALDNQGLHGHRPYAATLQNAPSTTSSVPPEHGRDVEADLRPTTRLLARR